MVPFLKLTAKIILSAVDLYFKPLHWLVWFYEFLSMKISSALSDLSGFILRPILSQQQLSRELKPKYEVGGRLTLNSGQFRELSKAILSAFPRRQSLAKMVQLELNKNMEFITSGASLKETVFMLIEVADKEEWLEDLIIAAVRYNHDDHHLRKVAKELMPYYFESEEQSED